MTAAASEAHAWSIASSTVIDTKSEPPIRCSSGRTASGKHKQPGQQKVPMTLDEKLSGDKSNAKSSVKKSSNSRVVGTSQQQQQQQQAVSSSKAASSTTGDRSKKVSKTNKSISSSGGVSKKTASSSSKSKAVVRTGTIASTTSGQSSKQQRVGRSSSSSKGTTTVSTSQLLQRQHSRDPESSLDSTAIVPVTSSPPSTTTQSIKSSNLDPPCFGQEGASTSGSSSSTERNYYDSSERGCTDPPSVGGSSTGSREPGYAKVYKSKNRGNKLAVWNEDEEATEGTTNASREDTSSRMQRSTAPEDDDDGDASDESSYYSDDDDMDSVTRSIVHSIMSTPQIDGNETLASAVERALAIHGSEGGSSRSGGRSGGSYTRSARGDEEGEGDDDVTNNDNGSNGEGGDALALVQGDYYESDTVSGQRQLVEGGHHNQHVQPYLATAVDNHHAIVPIDSTIYEAYDHTFVTCPENLRLRFLYTFLKKNLDKKIMIFFSTTKSAIFHARLLEHFHIPVSTMHGKQRREKFINRFFKFSDLDEGILCATDEAGRDLDIPPSVDWVIQFEPPDDPSEYILRVARISCDTDRVGRSLLFLNPGEHGFLKYYHSASIPVSEFEIPYDRLADVQGHVEYVVNESERLLRSARDAYGSYLIAYASHGFRDVYNVHDLNKNDVAVAFGLVGLHNVTEDDMTAETDTLAAGNSSVGRGEGGDSAQRKNSSGGKGKGWEKKEKPKSKTWMKGEKSWPHSQIKMHPKFKNQGGGMSSSAQDLEVVNSKSQARIYDHLYD